MTDDLNAVYIYFLKTFASLIGLALYSHIGQHAWN